MLIDKVKKVKITDNLTIGNDKIFLIAGPCVIESEDLVMEVAGKMKDITNKLGIQYVFKASFDKANRSSISSFRGPGLTKGLEILARVKEKYGVALATDIHEPWQCKEASKVIDLLQIPAFLSRQTDLLIAAAETGKAVNIKKGQFLAPWDMKNVVRKFEEVGNENIMLCERGASFGYNNLVVDMRGLLEMRKFGYPVVFDATHSVQIPGGQGETSGGNRAYVYPLARAAVSIGVDGVFAEVHPEPDEGLSDGPNMLKLDDVEDILTKRLPLLFSSDRAYIGIGFGGKQYTKFLNDKNINNDDLGPTGIGADGTKYPHHDEPVFIGQYYHYGVVGTAFFVALVFYMLFVSFKRYLSNNKFYIAIFGSILCTYIFRGLFETIYFTHLYVMLGLFIVFYAKTRSDL